MKNQENIKKIIFNFIKTLDVDLSHEDMKNEFKSFLEEKNFDIDNSLLLKVLENEDFISNLTLLHEIEEYLGDTLEDLLVQDNDGTTNITGIVSFINLEAGFWAIKSGEEKYSPINLPEELKKEGLEVDLTVKLLPNLVTTIMWGKSIEILSYIIKNN